MIDNFKKYKKKANEIKDFMFRSFVDKFNKKKMI